MEIKSRSRITKHELLESEKKWYSEDHLKKKYLVEGEDANSFKNKPVW